MTLTHDKIKARNADTLRKVEADIAEWTQLKRDCAVDWFFSYRNQFEYTDKDVQDFRELWMDGI